MTEQEFEKLFIEEDIIDKNKKEKVKRVLSEESAHDIKEVLKLNSIIRNTDNNVIYINGNYGIGKSYKVTKAINLYCNKEDEYIIFESFETGFRDNFIYILYGKIKYK